MAPIRRDASARAALQSQGKPGWTRRLGCRLERSEEPALLTLCWSGMQGLSSLNPSWHPQLTYRRGKIGHPNYSALYCLTLVFKSFASSQSFNLYQAPTAIRSTAIKNWNNKTLRLFGNLLLKGNIRIISSVTRRWGNWPHRFNVNSEFTPI